MPRAGWRSSQQRNSGDVGAPASREDRNRSSAGPHDRRGPLGAGDLPDTRNHRHDRRVHRFVGQCVEVITAPLAAGGGRLTERAKPDFDLSCAIRDARNATATAWMQRKIPFVVP
jgi:hypothetical protein